MAEIGKIAALGGHLGGDINERQSLPGGHFPYHMI
jgi:hypothetical protein